MRRPVALLAALAAAVLVASGCGSSDRHGSQKAAATYATNGTFTMAINRDPGSYDPYPVGGAGVTAMNYLAYDSLVNPLPNGDFVSGLAQDWKVDATSATFTLRSGITCSDGALLTASQVADAITWNLDPTKSWMYGFYTPTVPLTATADDASRTVKVVMKKPYGFLLQTIGQLPIVCAKGMKNRTMLKTASDGTGPFVLTKVVGGQSATYTVRKGYRWGPNGASTSAPGTPAKVVLRVVENETTAANLLTSGDLNLAQIGAANQQRLKAAGLVTHDWKTGGAWLSFNHGPGRVTADRRVREALIRALDLKKLIKVSTGGNGTAAKGLLPLVPTVCAGNTVSGLLPEHDVAAAGALLDQAGWTKGPDGIRRKAGKTLALDLIYFAVASELDKPTAEFLAQEWKALGIQVNIPGYSAAKGAEVLYKTSNWDVYVAGWEFVLPSQMVPFLSGPVPPDGTNILHLDNKKYNAIATKAVTMTPPEACKYWNDAERAIIGNLDLVPISTRVKPWFLQGAQARFQYRGATPTSLRVLK